ncbi:FliH/SctL family protein [Paenibacillus beijingensis]|uniref:Flagellar biosynthesis protein n=1 Tax=Paenibacillus beijingensis TaxID=1126833 RepID=A0A0D5NMR0_9BACL|nr:FliH/SctL family protein [Paenibacillus beijingensis]AJY76566.1 flagellar biosynthesis protein [Paenibacillus beijingensis]
MSNLIKSSHVVPLDALKRLEWIHRQQAAIGGGDLWSVTPETADEETLSLRDQILIDAQNVAEERLREAEEAAERLASEARNEIENWWELQRAKDEEAAEEARRAGYESGYADGLAQARLEASRQWEQRLAESKTLLETAYLMKDQIIQESEPFLLELSTAIAEKIIARQLTVSPEIAIELIRTSLTRRKEQGVIALCVSPEQLGFVQAAREELSLAIDSQAELQILPDATVKDHGCIIRSSFGSIDARIDTQLSEIKRELIHLALQITERGRSDES